MVRTRLHDADIAIWDAERETTIANSQLHHAVDYTPYEGMRIKGWPVTTLSRGEVVWDGGKVLGAPGRGKFLPCATPAMARPKSEPVIYRPVPPARPLLKRAV